MCKPCQSGSYCPEGAGAFLPCKAGTYSSATNLTDADECQQADPGYFATTGSSQQTACPAGSYTDASMAIRDTCTLCEDGKFQNVSGANSCQLCSTCEKGQWMPAPCIAQRDASCTKCANDPCPERYWQDGVCEGTINAFKCVYCEDDEYCPGDGKKYSTPSPPPPSPPPPSPPPSPPPRHPQPILTTL